MKKKSLSTSCGRQNLYSAQIKAVLLASIAGMFMKGGVVQAEESASSSGGGRIEEIVVTAQKRQESAQKVPITVAVLTSDSVRQMGISDTTSLSSAVPGLTFNRSGPIGQPFMRGVGSNNSTPGAEQAVSMYVDGVYIADGGANTFSLSNISSVEVLKGPQGTLFGRNSIGGVINITTKDPSHTPSADIMVGLGNYDTQESTFYGTSGVTENLAADLSIHYQKQTEGWGKNLTTGKEASGDQHDLEARTKWLWELGDRTQVTAIADYSHEVTTRGVSVRVAPGQTDIAGDPYPGHQNIRADLSPKVITGNKGGSLKIEHEFDVATLVSISAYHKTFQETTEDVEGSRLNVVNLQPTHNTGELFTQEIQLLSADDAPFRWITGLYYLHNKAGSNTADFTGGAFLSQFSPIQALAPAGSLFVGTTGKTFQTTDSYSGFAEATFVVLPDTNLTAGIRYTYDNQHFHTNWNLLTGPVFSSPLDALNGPFSTVAPPVNLFPAAGTICAAGRACIETEDKSFHKPTYRLVLDHQFTPDIMGYASYSRGFQSGVFNTTVQSFPTTSVDPETADAYEIGMKSELFDEALRLNVSAFYEKLKGMQLFTAAAGVVYTTNAGNSEIKGVDIDFEALPFENLTLRGGLEYLDTRFTSYQNAPFYTYVPLADRGLPGNQGVPLNTGSGDATGNELTQAPTLTYVLGGTYDIPTASGDFALNLNVNYNGGFYWDVQNRVSEDAFYKVNASIRWTAPNGVYNVELWGRNLTNAKTNVFSLAESFGDMQAPGAPATYGVRFTTHF